MIVKEIKKLLKRIYYNGIEINGTREIVNCVMNIDNPDIEKESREVVNLYNKFIGNFEDKMSLERTHYDFLRAAMMHKFDFNAFFFDQDYTSRKIVIHSEDCISTIQFLGRESNHLIVNIRSSDVLRLLPLDLLFCVRLINDIIVNKKLDKSKLTEIKVYITSAHYYNFDKEVVKVIIDGN